MKKKLLLLFVMVSWIVSANAQWPTYVDNRTNCSASITVRCYDLCINGISHSIVVPPNKYVMDVLDTCYLGSNGHVSTIYEICIDDPIICGPPDCTYIIGPGNGNDCGLPIGVPLTNCPNCSKTGTSITAILTGNIIRIQ